MPEAAPAGAGSPFDPEALLDQLAYLGDEVAALEQIIERVPNVLLEGRPTPDERSIKETYGLIAARDARRRLPLVRHLAGDVPSPDLPDEAALLGDTEWNALPMGELLAQVRAARAAFVEALRDLPQPAWQRPMPDGTTLAGWVYGIIQDDAARLREMAERLHASHMTQRPHDLPK